MADSPTPVGHTPETGTPGLSPARTPPALMSVEELLQDMRARSPGTSQAMSPASTSGRSVAHGNRVERYPRLHFASASHPLQRLELPSEEVLRAVALEGRPDVGPPPRLPHQLSPELQAVLLGWRSVYEQCRDGPALQSLVGECYAAGAVFEDALVSARGQEALYRQFAMLGAAVRAVQVGAYSLSVTPLAQPVVRMLPAVSSVEQAQPSQASPSQARRQGLRQAGRQAPPPPQQPPPPVPLHLTRVTIENVQCFTLGVPSVLAWMVGSKGGSVQVPLYVTSVLLVASDAPLTLGGEGGGGAADTTATRLASAAAALGGAGGAAVRLFRGEPGGTSSISGTAVAAATAAAATPHWRIVHHLDRWHNVPLVWWALRRALCIALDAVLSPLLRL